MQATNHLRGILNAAEQAVAREDASAAERLLREALALQESTPGSARDDIAKTLNNLAVVCEMTGKLKDAETCYRRAFKIATASLPASDPFVTTSRENLEAFCKAQGLPLAPQPASAPPRIASSAPAPPAAPPRVASPAPAPPAAPSRVASPAPSLAPPRLVSSPPPPSRTASAVPAQTTHRVRWILVGVLLVAALAVAIVLARDWRTRPSVDKRGETISRSEPVTPAPPAAEAPTPAPAPDPAPAPPAPEPEPVAAAPAPIAPTPEPPRATPSSSSPTVVSAQLCRSLSRTGAWRCESASGTQAPGTLYFYTRVAAVRATVIEHRWYRDDVLYQRVPLRIRPNQSGFRTYSRNTVRSDRAGPWKVELRSEDGRVLHEETFAVR